MGARSWKNEHVLKMAEHGEISEMCIDTRNADGKKKMRNGAKIRAGRTENSTHKA